MKDSDKKILLVFLGIVILAAVLFFVVKPLKEDTDNLNADNETLQARVTDLQEKAKHEDEYRENIVKYNEEFQKELTQYPTDLNQETTVVFMRDVEKNLEFVNNSWTMPREADFVTITGVKTDKDGKISDTNETAEYTAKYCSYDVTYKGSYDGLKKYLDYIAKYKYRMTISDINIAYKADAPDPKDMCNGTVTLNAYAVSGGSREISQPSVSVATGKKNIFAKGNSAGGTGTASAGEAVSYDSNNGEDIVLNHNLVILLNNAKNDTTSGIIVAADESKEDTYVTSADNEAKDLKIAITEESGKNYVTYTIGSNSFKTEITTKDFTVYVKSTARVDADDQNAVNVSVSNDTKVPVYFKVVDDDSTTPRFVLKDTKGSVKTY